MWEPRTGALDSTSSKRICSMCGITSMGQMSVTGIISQVFPEDINRLAAGKETKARLKDEGGNLLIIGRDGPAGHLSSGQPNCCRA